MCAQRRDFNMIGLVPCFLVLLFFIGTGFAQITWRRTYGGSSAEKGYCVDQTTDGGYIVVGLTASFGNDIQVYLLRVDTLGDTIWTKNYGGSGWDWGMCVQQTTDGGYIVVGFTNSFGDSFQIYLIKTDSLGDTLWTRTYGGPGNERGYWVRQTRDGGYIISGGAQLEWGLDPVYLIKTDSLGNVEWNKAYFEESGAIGMEVQQTTDGGYIVIGSNLTLIKTDSLGDTLWTKHYSYPWNFTHSIQQTTDGGYIVVGSTYAQILTLLKTDSLGDTIWVRTYVGPDGGLKGYSGEQTVDGGYIATGKYCVGQESLASVYLLKTDSIGDTLWFKEFTAMLPNAWAWGNCVRQTVDGGYIIAGETDENGGDVYLIKTDQDGNVAGIEETGRQGDGETRRLEVYPNPFRNHCVIKFQIPSTKFQTNLQTDVGQGFSLAIKIYDATGRLVKSFNHLTIQPFNQVVWDGTDDFGRRLPAGVYFCRLEIDETVVATKVVELK